ncbi:hypothetical protein APR04_005969 [Promicromonospora umidemergens]|uniref:Uncharacterized protein n=1 Tax=Promicromonospora umidemergens TaxID=629679 RepID=A0ABP8XVP3_9MICO|nr:hypothetical protein [Promicromonospora umidemergens]MCP2287022.1 hypothetical protein [Promicromonospora umidemergens]
MNGDNEFAESALLDDAVLGRRVAVGPCVGASPRDRSMTRCSRDPRADLIAIGPRCKVHQLTLDRAFVGRSTACPVDRVEFGLELDVIPDVWGVDSVNAESTMAVRRGGERAPTDQ